MIRIIVKYISALIPLLVFFTASQVSNAQRLKYNMGKTPAQTVLDDIKASAEQNKRAGKTSLYVDWDAHYSGGKLRAVKIRIKNLKYDNQKGDYWIYYNIKNGVYQNATVHYIAMSAQELKKRLLKAGYFLVNNKYIDPKYKFVHNVYRQVGVTKNKIVAYNIKDFNKDEQKLIQSRRSIIKRKRKIAAYKKAVAKREAVKAEEKKKKLAIEASKKAKEQKQKEQRELYERQKKDFIANSQTQHGGPLYGAFSVVVPGLGDMFVNRGRGSVLGNKIHPAFTTGLVYACIGGGVFCLLQSDKALTEFQNGTDFNTIHEAAKEAKFYDNLGMVGITAGALFWVSDIIWTVTRGKHNVRYKKRMRKKFGLAFIPSRGTNTILLTYRF